MPKLRCVHFLNTSQKIEAVFFSLRVPKRRNMIDADVVHRANQYLHIMSSLTPSSRFYFRSFASDGVDGLIELCDEASRVATAREGVEGDAIASLVITPGRSSTFSIDGTHARATLQACPTPHTRLIVLTILLSVALLLFIMLRRRA